MNTYFFRYPFALNGTRDPIDASLSSTGEMSYNYGFTQNYTLDLLTDPAALPIPWGKSNQLYYAITSNIQQYQTQAVPEWITSVNNGGTPYAYDKYALVRYDAGGGVEIYENQIAANTVAPGVDDTWTIVSGGAQSVPTGTIIDYAGLTLPTGYLACDGSQVSRTTYSLLLNALTRTESVTLTAPTSTFVVASTFGLYVGMKCESTGFTGGQATITNVDTGTNTVTINVATVSSGASNVTFFSWGNGNGTTTFNLPDMLRRCTVGQGGAPNLVLGNQVGQTGGGDTVTLQISEIPSHVHGATQSVYASTSAGPGPAKPGQLLWSNPVNNSNITISATGGDGPHNNIQASAVTYKIIKFT